MHRLRRFYYQNKAKIWKYILIIASILIIIYLLNYMIKIQNENKINNINSNFSNNDKTNTIINKPNNNTHITSDKSAVTGEILGDKVLENASNTIESFISACNKGNINEAYELLSDECKEELYPDINKFKTLYYDIIFGGEAKYVTIENWISNTYKVNITEDIMSTGNVNGLKTQDYMTIVKNENQYKLNINNFVKKEKINKSQTIKDIKFTIINKKVYMDYEEYDIQVENETDGRILLDSKKNTKSIYIEDNNGIKYYSDSHEIPSALLKINKGFSSQLTIKFSKSYSNNRITKNIIFSDILFNYNDTISEEIEKNKIMIEI